MLSRKEIPENGSQKRGSRESILLSIEIFGPWVFMIAVLILTTTGHLLEGRLSFILIFIAKLCAVICSAEILFLLAVFTEPVLLRRLYLVGMIIFIFLLLRNPVLDLPYLVHPAQENLTRISLDYNLDNSTSRYLNGAADTNKGTSSFTINGSTYKKLSVRTGTTVHLEYLPHTKHVIRISE